MPTRTVTLDGPLDLARTLGPLSRGPGDRTIQLGPGRAVPRVPDTRTATAPSPSSRRRPDAAMRGLGTRRRPAPGRRPGAGRGQRRRPDADPRRPVPAGPRPRAAIPGHPLDADRRGHGGPRPGHPRAEGHRRFRPASLVRPDPDPRHRRARAARPDRAPALRLPPPDETLAALPYFDYHPFGVERRRADLIRRVSGRASWFEATVELPARRGAAPAHGHAGPGAVDRGRGRRPGPRRSRRGERRRLPPQEPRLVGPGRRAARDR